VLTVQVTDLYCAGPGRRCCRPLRRAAREGHCAMRGREALDPGFGELPNGRALPARATTTSGMAP